MPANTEEVLRSYRRVVLPEMNLGQLALLVRGMFLVDAIGVNQVRGLPFRVDELVAAIRSVIDGTYTQDRDRHRRPLRHPAWCADHRGRTRPGAPGDAARTDSGADPARDRAPDRAASDERSPAMTENPVTRPVRRKPAAVSRWPARRPCG